MELLLFEIPNLLNILNVLNLLNMSNLSTPATSFSFTIGENTYIGRRKFQPFERIEHIEPFEHIIPPKHEGFFLTQSHKVFVSCKTRKGARNAKNSQPILGLVKVTNRELDTDVIKKIEAKLSENWQQSEK